jgi:hypothetical protein
MRFAVTGLRWAAPLLALSLGFRPVVAQVPAEVRWSLEGNRGSYCIWYLADPELARHMVLSGTALAPAGTGAGLPPLLARTVQDEPRFAQWIPGSICVGAYQRVTSDGRILAQEKRDRPVIVATSALAVQGPRGFAGASHVLIDFMTDQRALARAADADGFGMSGIKVITRLRVGADDPEVAISLDGVQIVWSGHAIGDSGVGRTRSMSFGYATSRSANWLIDLEWAPASSRTMVGALQVDGLNTLAKALKASPVRAIGPEESGGTTTFTFRSATRP